MTSILAINEDLDYSKLYLKPPMKSSGNLKYMLFFYNKQKLVFRLPKLTLPYGINRYGDNMYLDFSLKNNDQILYKLQELDVEIVTLIHKMFPEHAIDDIINNFQSGVKIPMNMSFAPTLRVKLTRDKSGEYTFSLYSTEKDIDGNYKSYHPTCDDEVADILTKKSEVSSLIELAGVWYNVADRKFGVTWRLVQAKVFTIKALFKKPPVVPEEEGEGESRETNGYAFQDDTDSDSSDDGNEA